MSGFEIKVEPLGQDELDKRFKAVPEVYEREMLAATWESTLLLEREVKELTPVGVGGGSGLRGSISGKEPVVLGAHVLGEVSTSLKHAIPVELGSKPHMPPVEPIADWAQSKLGLGPKEAKGAAFAIARKIKVKGTKGAHMFERGFEANQSQVRTIYSTALDRVMAHMGGAS